MKHTTLKHKIEAAEGQGARIATRIVLGSIAAAILTIGLLYVYYNYF